MAGLAVAVTFSLLILGAARAERRAPRRRRAAAAIAYSVAGAGRRPLAFCGVVVYGVKVIVKK